MGQHANSSWDVRMPLIVARDGSEKCASSIPVGDVARTLAGGAHQGEADNYMGGGGVKVSDREKQKDSGF